MRNPEQIRPWLMLKMLPGLGDIALYPLLQTLGSPERVFGAAPDELMKIGSCSSSQIQTIIQGPDHAVQQAVDQELRNLERSNIELLSCVDPAYPSMLHTIHDPPILLYMTGNMRTFEAPSLAIVGSRRANHLGTRVTEQFSQELASMGFIIVSGLARGIDAAAHRGALAGGGETIAVLGCGIDRTYPPEHASLRESIEANGVILSEFPLQSPPHAYHFPKRNRIISGLSLGVLVTQATAKSGSLITARLAAEQGREVFAVPGSVKDEQSRGPHELIKQGAKLVDQVHDILEELAPRLDEGLKNPVQKDPENSEEFPLQLPVQLKEEEVVVYNLLSYEPTMLDDLIVQSGIGAGTLNGLLLSMELKGIIRCLPGSRAVRV